jgi:very-short-patch-repair endonuclease
MDADKLRIAREKLTRVFRYLEALNQHRNPPKRQIHEQLWSLRLCDLPEHSAIRRGIAKLSSPKTKGGQSQDREAANANFILKVERPRLTRPPAPPNEIAAWLQERWDDPAQPVVFEESMRDESTDGALCRVASLTDDPARVASFERWKLARSEWVSTEKPARAAMKIFESLYSLYGRIDREGERVELVLGDGILSWRRSEGSIYHPILLQRLQLEFNAAVPEFTISEADHPVELYSALFQSMNDVDGRVVGRCREELEGAGFHPLVNGATSEFLKRLVVQLSARGEFSEQAPEKEASDPCIGRDPLLFLRGRTLGFAAAIEGILADLRTREDLPWSLLNIVGEEFPNSNAGDASVLASGSAPLHGDVLLSKPANQEQIRIAQQLEEHGGVLVQGPPGTGKTHTIGNLIGHLLAQGKSVLVTSHTTKALRMVRHHIVPELRPLCVSLLESDLDSRKQLESAVGSIAERLAMADAGSLELEAKRLESERADLLKELEEIRVELMDARAAEYRDIVIGGKAWVPADAARQVAQEKGTHAWIPGPVAAVAPLPLVPGDLADLYRSSVSISREDENELSGHLPDLHSLPRVEEFEDAIGESNRLRMEDLDVRSDLWDSHVPSCSPGVIEGLAAALTKAVEPLSGRDQWKLAAVYAGKYGDVHRQPWDQLVALVRLVHREAGCVQESFFKFGPEASGDVPAKELERIADEIVAHLEGGGRLGSLTMFAHKSWSQFLEQTKVNNVRPSRVEHFRALREFLRLQVLRQDLRARWDRQMVPLGAPNSKEMGEEPEKTLIQYCDSIEDCLGWQEHTWRPLRQQIFDVGFHWEKLLAEQPAIIGSNGELRRIGKAVIDELLPVFESRFKKSKLLQLEEERRELKTQLKLASRMAKASKVTNQLLTAVSEEDAARYREAYEHLLELKSKQADLDLRRALLAKLEGAAPAWAGAIRNRSGEHGRGDPPRDAPSAWTWRQLNDELDRRASVCLESLQAKIEKLRERMRRLTVQLIDRRAWASQARRTSSRQRQALVGWLDTIRRIGKGHGIRVSLLRAEAARKMSECRGAVPVWVMPLSRVVENFDPRTTRFDVVVIDEASQSDVMALVALYLGRAALVVGDHEQVSPSAVGQDLGVIQNLIFQYLRDIPNADLYDGQMSIYDLARQSFGGTTCLVEHFRCVPEIIQFSNMISYDGRIRPLRDASRVHLRPHTIAHRVSGSSRDGKINRQESVALASLLAAALEQPEYKKNDAGQPMSFGVVSLVGDEQAIEIDNLIRAHVSPDRYELHRILCGNAAQLQGDERDVVFISLVDTAERGSLSLRDQELFKQRFNVAASRARDQMWIVHSLSPHHDLKPDDLRRQLIEHAEDPMRLMSALEEQEKRTQSDFERELMKRLLAAGYRVSPHWRIGKYRLDLVVEGGGSRLAIECDGDRYRPLEKLPEDMERQSVLERMGWTFTHVRGSEFLRNPSGAMRVILEKLEKMGIPTTADSSGEQSNDHTSHDVIDRVVRRAEELRKAWSKSNGESPRSTTRSSVAARV